MPQVKVQILLKTRSPQSHQQIQVAQQQQLQPQPQTTHQQQQIIEQELTKTTTVSQAVNILVVHWTIITQTPIT